MRRIALLLLLTCALRAHAETTRYLIRPIYTSVRFSIVKWGVLKEEGVFREFAGTLDYDSQRPELARVDVVVEAASIDTKDETRDSVLRSDDFFDVARYKTLEFHSSGVMRINNQTFISGNLTIHGVTRAIRFPATALGTREIKNVGSLAGFETTFRINRRDFGILGNRWGAVPGVMADEVEIHIIIGAVRRR